MPDAIFPILLLFVAVAVGSFSVGYRIGSAARSITTQSRHEHHYYVHEEDETEWEPAPADDVDDDGFVEQDPDFWKHGKASGDQE